MEEQIEFARLLHDSGYGIALRKPVHDINVGDLCYWSEGKAIRILNVFDNRQWLERNNWPRLDLDKDEALDVLQGAKIQIVHGGGCWWGVQRSAGAPVGFDICFQRLAQHTAVLMPSSPTTIMGLRSSASHIIDQWWALAKRYVFRTWSYLLNSGTGVFLVKSCVKTHRFAACLSRGTQGQLTQIRIHGMTALTANADQIDLTAAGTTWIPYRNDLGFEFHDSGGQQEYTVFIKRDASRMFTLTDVTLKEAAHRVWMSCTGAQLSTSASVNNGWLASSHPSWNNSPAPAPPPPPTPQPSSAGGIFDGKDRIKLKEEEWFLIKGGDQYFLEHATSGLDVSSSQIDSDKLLKVLKSSAPPAPPQTIGASPLQQQPAPVAPPLPFPAPNPLVNNTLPGLGPLPGGFPIPQGGAFSLPQAGAFPLPQGGPFPIPQGGPLGIPQGGPLGIPQGGPLGIPQGGPLGSPGLASPFGVPPQFGVPPAGIRPLAQPIQMPGIAAMSPPLNGVPRLPGVGGVGVPGVNPGIPGIGIPPGIVPQGVVPGVGVPGVVPAGGVGAVGVPTIQAVQIGAQPLEAPKMPETSGGPASVLPNYEGFNFLATASENGHAIVRINPPGMPADVPWDWIS